MRSGTLDIRQLRYFVKIVEAGGFTKAAEQLRVAQPALSSGVRKLEQELGEQLLERHSRGVALTPAGAILLESAREIIAKFNETKAQLKQGRVAPSGTLRVGLPPSVSGLLATALVREFSASHGDVKLHLVEDLSPILLEWLDEDRLDMALAYQDRNARGLASEPLHSTQLHFVSAAGAQRSDTITLAEVAKRPLAMVSTTNGMIARLLKSAANERTLGLEVAFEMQSLSVVLQLVEEGMAGAIVPYDAVAKHVQRGALAAQRIVEPELGVTLSLFYKPRPDTALLVAGLALVRDTAMRLLKPNGPVR